MKILDFGILILNLFVLLLALLNFNLKNYVPFLIIIYLLAFFLTVLSKNKYLTNCYRFFYYIFSFFTLLLVLHETFFNSFGSNNKFILFFSILGLIFIFLVTVFYYQFLPPFVFPPVSGEFSVGVKNFHFKDFNRIEYHADNQNYRELFIQFWYPSKEDSKCEKSQYMPEVIDFAQKQMTLKTLIPLSIFDEFKKFTTNSVYDAKISDNEDNFPVLIFSHGLQSVCSLNTSNIEDLASHGYIVIGVNHTFSSYCTYLSDGKTVPCHDKFKMSALKIIKDNLESQVELLECELKTWCSDVTFVIDELEKINQDKESPFYKKLDLDKIGIFGHSLGGALAGDMCLKDDRIKVGASLDGAILEDTANADFKKPFMFIVGVLLGHDLYPCEKKLKALKITKEQWDNTLNKYRKNIKKLCDKLGEHAYYIIIEGAGHYSFTDISLLKPVISKYLQFDLSFTHNKDVTKITNKYLLDFFDKYLKNKNLEIKPEKF